MLSMVATKLDPIDPTIPNGDLLSVAEVAALRGVTPKNVYRAIELRHLKASSKGKAVCIVRSDAEAWEPSRTHQERARRAAAARWKGKDGESDG